MEQPPRNDPQVATGSARARRLGAVVCEQGITQMAGNTFSDAAFWNAAGALGILATVLTASPAAAGSSFPAAVEQILRHQQSGPVSRLPADKKDALIACVKQVLADMPNGRKRYVIQAANFDELEHRFGKVVLENRAEWKQKIARNCSHIVV